MKKFHLTSLLLIFGLLSQAQNISVADFYLAENDLTARTHGTSVEDQNGNICALIKVKTTEKGNWAFDVGMLGVRKTEDQNKMHPAEIWVYVPFSVTWISIQHDKLGELDHYVFPCSIDKGCTYVMKLTTGKVKIVVEEEVTQQYLLFQLDPPNATLEVNDKLWTVGADGTAMQYVDFGAYTYRVRAKDYHPEVGKVTVDDPENTKVVPVSLKPNFATVTFTVDADAEIWVNNEKKGIRTWTGPLGSGTYKIECKQADHETSMVSKEISPAMNGQTITLTAPTPIYGSLNVESTPNLATIYLDGKEIGKTPKSIHQILIGQHEIKLTKEGHADYIETVTIVKSDRKEVNATLNKKTNDVQQTTITPPLAVNSSGTGMADLTFNVNGVSFAMKFVEGGTFQMGATSEQDGEAEDDEKPVHSVTLSNFYIGETEVTQALWKAVMGTAPSDDWESWTWNNRQGRGDDYPAYYVSWNYCQDFIVKLNKLTGKNFRLPTEAEWEYAARGGKNIHHYKYAGSNNINNVAVYGSIDKDEKSPEFGTQKVKSKSPNELGLFDMSGNVWEWCQDWYGDYSNGSQINPLGPTTGNRRIIRGGEWYFGSKNCRVSLRASDSPKQSSFSHGFRLALSREDNNPTSENSQKVKLSAGDSSIEHSSQKSSTKSLSWRDVVVTTQYEDVHGMIFTGESIVSGNLGYKNAVKKIQKEAAEKGCCKVLIINSKQKEIYPETPLRARLYLCE